MSEGPRFDNEIVNTHCLEVSYWDGTAVKSFFVFNFYWTEISPWCDTSRQSPQPLILTNVDIQHKVGLIYRFVMMGEHVNQALIHWKMSDIQSRFYPIVYNIWSYYFYTQELSFIIRSTYSSGYWFCLWFQIIWGPWVNNLVP